jgi:UDP-glucose 4-epimerase
MALARSGYLVRAAARQPIVFESSDVEGVAVGDMSRSFAADFLVRGVDAVVHAAGTAHSRAGLPDAAYTAINVDATRQLARAARAARVKRFILISSVRAQTGPSHRGTLTEDDLPAPTDAYGRSKLAAETVTADALTASSSRWTALRPVLVYGPKVKGNMAALLRLATAEMPLPFGSMKSRRSLLSVGNLISAITHALEDRIEKDGPYLVADEFPLTLGEIVADLRRGLGRRPRLLPVPEFAVAAALRMAGKHELAERLAGELVVNARKLHATGWRPLESTSDALAAMAKAETTARRH